MHPKLQELVESKNSMLPLFTSQIDFYRWLLQEIHSGGWSTSSVPVIEDQILAIEKFLFDFYRLSPRRENDKINREFERFKNDEVKFLSSFLGRTDTAHLQERLESKLKEMLALSKDSLKVAGKVSDILSNNS